MESQRQLAEDQELADVLGRDELMQKKITALRIYCDAAGISWRTRVLRYNEPDEYVQLLMDRLSPEQRTRAALSKHIVESRKRFQ